MPPIRAKFHRKDPQSSPLLTKKMVTVALSNGAAFWQRWNQYRAEIHKFLSVKQCQIWAAVRQMKHVLHICRVVGTKVHGGDGHIISSSADRVKWK
ncbi:hypothetical protein X801_10231, partial [Opisthorchis viverrini]